MPFERSSWSEIQLARPWSVSKISESGLKPFFPQPRPARVSWTQKTTEPERGRTDATRNGSPSAGFRTCCIADFQIGSAAKFLIVLGIDDVRRLEALRSDISSPDPLTERAMGGWR